MIHYLVAERLAFRMQWYLETEPALSGRLAILPYERAWRETSFEPGVYIFSDLEWLTGAGLQASIELWTRLADVPGTRLLNDPARALRRYDLLHLLHEEGINEFAAYRLPPKLERSPPFSLRYPVFVRCEHAHTGSQSDLLYSWKEVRKAARAALASREYGTNELLAVEYCDTSDANGVFRKYSAFVVGDAIVPRHLVHSLRWVVKTFQYPDADLLRESRRYVAENPHAAFLREIAQRANIEWGRFDYSLLGGRPQVWEINTNPIVMAPVWDSDVIDVDHLNLELHRVPMRRIASALLALEGVGEEAPPLTVTGGASRI